MVMKPMGWILIGISALSQYFKVYLRNNYSKSTHTQVLNLLLNEFHTSRAESHSLFRQPLIAQTPQQATCTK